THDDPHVLRPFRLPRHVDDNLPLAVRVRLPGVWWHAVAAPLLTHLDRLPLRHRFRPPADRDGDGRAAGDRRPGSGLLRNHIALRYRVAELFVNAARVELRVADELVRRLERLADDVRHGRRLRSLADEDADGIPLLHRPRGLRFLQEHDADRHAIV